MPRVRLLLPQSLRLYWDVAASADLEGATLAEALGSLDGGVRARILDDQGRVREHVLVFVNGQRVRREDLATVALADGDVVRVLPAVSGG